MIAATAAYSRRIGVLLVAVLLALVFISCKKENPVVDGGENLDQLLLELIEEASGGQGAAFFLLPESNNYAAIPQDPNNPLNPAKVHLGKLLFHEPALGRNAAMPLLSTEEWSCATCHIAGAGFQANVPQGIGEGGVGFGIAGEARVKDPLYSVDWMDVQSTRSPSILNVAYQEVTLWNGQFGSFDKNIGTESRWTPGTPREDNNFGYAGPEIQAIAGIRVHRSKVDMSLVEDYPEYAMLFEAAFPGVPLEVSVSREYAGLAIAAYERTVLANKAPFQWWLRGDRSAMSRREKQGALLFFGKAECVTCHNGPALAENDFHALGMNDLQGHTVVSVIDALTTASGRGGFTGLSDDDYKFKVPQLYNLKDSPFYGHGASFHSVKAVVEYKNSALSQNPNVPEEQLSPHFKPLHLTTEEINDLVRFVEDALYDHQLQRYVPLDVPSGLCFPNNDFQSQSDLGCF
ncbi:MAG: cytochrome-c peroxidase [Cryomorphaceae bacterium]|nr:MAG: cytochrome-c peroxidase [Cryomorphaceae bacterium]